jgi:drug/metabolite transporter (DMT)-like permease
VLHAALAALSGLVWGVGDFAGGKAAQTAAAMPVAWVSKLFSLLALVLGGLVLAIRRPKGWPHGAALRWSLVAGPFDLTANVFYLLATRHGDLSVVAPLAALGPVTTVILALLMDRERMRRIQVLGLGLAVLALILINR